MLQFPKVFHAKNIKNTVANGAQFELLNLNIYPKVCDAQLHLTNYEHIYAPLLSELLLKCRTKILKYYKNIECTEEMK